MQHVEIGHTHILGAASGCRATRHTRGPCQAVPSSLPSSTAYQATLLTKLTKLTQQHCLRGKTVPPPRKHTDSNQTHTHAQQSIQQPEFSSAHGTSSISRTPSAKKAPKKHRQNSGRCIAHSAQPGLARPRNVAQPFLFHVSHLLGGSGVVCQLSRRLSRTRPRPHGAYQAPDTTLTSRDPPSAWQAPPPAHLPSTGQHLVTTTTTVYCCRHAGCSASNMFFFKVACLCVELEDTKPPSIGSCFTMYIIYTL